MYAFIHIPKTGGSTVRHVLRSSFGAQHCDIKVQPKRRKQQPWILPHDLRIARKIYPDMKGICGHRVTCFTGLDGECPDIRYFTFLRDPYKRFVSHFNHHLRDNNLPRTEEVLHEFASLPERNNMICRMLCGKADAATAIQYIDQYRVFVGLMQHFNESFCMLGQWMEGNLLKPFYRLLNKAPRSYALPLSDNSRVGALVLQTISEDAKVFEHVVNDVFPRQRHEYVGDLDQDVAKLEDRNLQSDPLEETTWSKIKRNIIYKPYIHICRSGGH